MSKTTIEHVLMAVMAVPALLAEKVANECTEALKKKIVDAYDRKESAEVIRGLVGSRKDTEEQTKPVASKRKPKTPKAKEPKAEPETPVTEERESTEASAPEQSSESPPG